MKFYLKTVFKYTTPISGIYKECPTGQEKQLTSPMPKMLQGKWNLFLVSSHLSKIQEQLEIASYTCLQWSLNQKIILIHLIINSIRVSFEARLMGESSK